jgi:hypothetical protein
VRTIRRLLLVSSIVAFAAMAFTPVQAHASDDDGASAVAISMQQEVDDNDDTRVEVQLLVLGLVVGVVFVGGIVLYVVRKRLGLVPPPPDDAAAGSHH